MNLLTVLTPRQIPSTGAMNLKNLSHPDEIGKPRSPWYWPVQGCDRGVRPHRPKRGNPSGVRGKCLLAISAISPLRTVKNGQPRLKRSRSCRLLELGALLLTRSEISMKGRVSHGRVIRETLSSVHSRTASICGRGNRDLCAASDLSRNRVRDGSRDRPNY